MPDIPAEDIAVLERMYAERPDLTHFLVFLGEFGVKRCITVPNPERYKRLDNREWLYRRAKTPTGWQRVDEGEER